MEVHSKEKVFITGITGFSGVHLERELIKSGYEVYGSTFSTPNKVNHYKCNILQKHELHETISEVKPDYFIHLAAISFVASENIPLMYETNIVGTLNIFSVLEELKLKVKKILIASSAAVYGNIGNELSEDMPPRPVNHYGNSKLAMENMVSNYFKKFNIIITRPFNYTGVGQEANFLVPKIVSHFKDRKPMIELGNLDTYREYNNVNFLTYTYKSLLKNQYKSGIINICSGKTYSIKNILDTLEKISKHTIEISVNKKFVRVNEIKELKGSTTKLKKILGHELQDFSLEETLRKMYLV